MTLPFCVVSALLRLFAPEYTLAKRWIIVNCLFKGFLVLVLRLTRCVNEKLVVLIVIRGDLDGIAISMQFHFTI